MIGFILRVKRVIILKTSIGSEQASQSELPEENVLSKPLSSFIASEHCEALINAISEAIRTGSSRPQLVCDIITSHNERRTMSLCIVALRDTQGNIIGVSAVGEDVTNAMRAAKEIRDSRKQVLDILESISDAFFALDDSWRFTYINKHAEKILGSNKTTLLFRDMRKSTPKLMADKLHKLAENAKKDTESITSEEYFPIIRSWFDVRVNPYEHGISVYLTDITKRKMIEEQLITPTNRDQSLLNSTYEGIFALDTNGCCTLFNKSATKMLGYTQ